jgi:hypothetical protein
MANKIYVVGETAITWQDTSGTKAMTLNNLASGAGRQGAVQDLGTAAKSRQYMWRAFCQFATAPVVNEIVQIFLKTTDGTSPDNDDGTGDIAVSSADKLQNLIYLGAIVVDEAATGIKMVGHGIIEIPQKEVMPIFWNDTADNLVATNNLNGFSLTPIPSEIQ